MVAKAEGAPCKLSGVDGVCGREGLYCVGGVCATSTAGGSQGDECRRVEDCTDGSSCLFSSETFPVARRACGFSRIPLGGACSVNDGAFCDIPARLACVNDTCASADDGSLPGAGQVCNADSNPACANSEQSGTGATLSCRNTSSPFSSFANATRVCVWIRPTGTPCGTQDDPDAPAVCKTNLCVGGTCLWFNQRVAPSGERCAGPGDCDPATPLVCRNAGARGRGNLNRVSVAASLLGGTCDGVLNQCADEAAHRCVGGVCVVKAALGEPCGATAECAEGECWRGAGSRGPTCRAWAGWAAACNSTAVKCWQGLTCGPAGTCSNPGGRDTPAGNYCSTDGDCVTADGDVDAYKCVPNGVRDPFPGCKRQLAPGESCNIRFTQCPADFPCSESACRRLVGWGGPCGGAGEVCGGGLTCGANATCASDGRFGQACRTSAD